jgi:predicted phosphoribosyltransferase
MTRPFLNRQEAGRLLADRLADYAGRSDVIVLGLPRGGVPVAFEVATALDAPLDVFLVRKLGTPGQRELAMGAIASGGIVVINDDVVQVKEISQEMIEAVIAREREELERLDRRYRAGREPLDVQGRVVVLVDDGMATGSTMKAAVRALRRMGPDEIIVAVPTGAQSACEELRLLADHCICLVVPEPFRAVGFWYEDFDQTSDQDVQNLLRQRAAAPREFPEST